MKRASAYALAAALCAVPALAAAQNPVSDAFRGQEERAARIIPAAIEAFPAAKFSYRPTKEQMSVAQVAAHLVEEGNYMLCSRATGVAEPQRPKVDSASSREALIAALRASFEFCHTALTGLTDAQLADSAQGFGPRKFTRAQYVLITVGDWEDHYSQLANYLRLNNMVPPTAQPRRGM